ncbi:MAG: class I SAM-dependent methyltransferase [Rhodospirillales bacterium]|nr:class I SAM-dependent methyltransferase [Rhodospirillales bacterium]
MTKRRTPDVLTDLLDLKNKRVADIGCGDGALTRLMTRQGATVIGLDTNPKQLEKAQSAEPAGKETYGTGGAEDLPFENSSMDVIVFSNSLHHVPVDLQDKALEEAARVLKPGGYIFISEPLAEGPHFEMQQPYHDETEVRARAYEAIGRADMHGLKQVQEIFFTGTSRHKDFETYRERTLRTNPTRKDKFLETENQVRANFERVGIKTEEGFLFDQPMRVNLLRKA